MKPILTRYLQNFSRSILIVTILVISISCEDFVEIEAPETDIVSETVFQSNATATSAVLHLYTEMNTSSDFAGGGSSSISLLQGLNADELTTLTSSVSTELESFFFNNVLSTGTEVANIWSTCYSIIYGTNAIIEGLKNSSRVSPELQEQLEGEAKFIRAFCHFYLVNLFGDIPYISSTDYRINSNVSRVSVSEVYQGITNDLLEAKDLLNNDYPTSNRVRPNRGVVTALLARVYLYMEDWINAEIQASEIIDSNSMYSLSEVDQTFLISSNETIWQLFPDEDNNNGNDGSTFIVVDVPRFVVMSEDLFNSFEDGDVRKEKWIGSVTSDSETYIFPFKYKSQDSDPESEYTVVFRLAEQYLIRAEARAQQSNLSGAISDLDVIRQRAELPLVSVTNPNISQSNLLFVIEQERRLELFTEWGHRWFDLKRTGRAGTVLSVVKEEWESTDVLLPIPQNETELNQNLTQNPGY